MQLALSYAARAIKHSRSALAQLRLGCTPGRKGHVLGDCGKHLVHIRSIGAARGVLQKGGRQPAAVQGDQHAGLCRLCEVRFQSAQILPDCAAGSFLGEFVITTPLTSAVSNLVPAPWSFQSDMYTCSRAGNAASSHRQPNLDS